MQGQLQSNWQNFFWHTSPPKSHRIGRVSTSSYKICWICHYPQVFMTVKDSAGPGHVVGWNLKLNSHSTLKIDNNDIPESELLECLMFNVTCRYLGSRCGYCGTWRTIFEVDLKDPFNKEVIDEFNSIRESWNMSGRPVSVHFLSNSEAFNFLIGLIRKVAKGCE